MTIGVVITRDFACNSQCQQSLYSAVALLCQRDPLEEKTVLISLDNALIMQQTCREISRLPRVEIVVSCPFQAENLLDCYREELAGCGMLRLTNPKLREPSQHLGPLAVERWIQGHCDLLLHACKAGTSFEALPERKSRRLRERWCLMDQNDIDRLRQLCTEPRPEGEVAVCKPL